MTRDVAIKIARKSAARLASDSAHIPLVEQIIMEEMAETIFCDHMATECAAAMVDDSHLKTQHEHK